MSFFKKLTRSRTNSGSYQHEEDDTYERVNTHDGQPPSSYRDPSQANAQSPPSENSQHDSRMYSSHSSQDGYSNTNNRPQGMSARDSGFVDSGTPQHQHQQPMMGSSKPMDALSAPDLLTAAFNAAVKPYTDRIAQLEEQMHNMSAQLQRFEQERHIICSWIDKRGLRADVPPEMTAIIDSTPDAAQQLHRAIDRKVTIVNFDLHRLQDDLGESISVGYFSTCMLKIVPELHRLSHLTGGAALAHEQIIKMVGNLTSHLGSGIGEGKTQEEVDEDKHAQESFFREIDEVLYGVTKQRERQQGGEFEVERELKRMTKNSEYLKQLGIFGYFPRTIGYLQQIGGHSQQREYDGGHGGQASPDRY